MTDISRMAVFDAAEEEFRELTADLAEWAAYCPCCEPADSWRRHIQWDHSDPDHPVAILPPDAPLPPELQGQL